MCLYSTWKITLENVFYSRYTTLVGTISKKFTTKRQFKQEEDIEDVEVVDANDTKKSKYSLSNVDEKKKSKKSDRGGYRGRKKIDKRYF
jgi:hypothetical protein